MDGCWWSGFECGGCHGGVCCVGVGDGYQTIRFVSLLNDKCGLL